MSSAQPLACLRSQLIRLALRAWRVYDTSPADRQVSSGHALSPGTTLSCVQRLEGDHIPPGTERGLFHA
jgi:hypothetical protein